MARQRHPNQKSPYQAIRGRRKATPKEDWQATLERDVKALDVALAAKPLKPPGRA